MNKECLFSSKTDLWETPQELFDHLNSIHHFDLDVCATPENAKCKVFFTREQNGLEQKWWGNCWCNPPYGREIGKWIQKAVMSDAKVVMLLPARTDAKWFHDYCKPFGTIEFIQGRLKFGKSKDNAPFPSMIVVFDHVGRKAAEWES